MKGAFALTAHRESLQNANQYLTELLKPCGGPCGLNESLCYICQKRCIDEDYLRKTLETFQAAFPVLVESLSTDLDCLKQRRQIEDLPLERRIAHNSGSTINLTPEEILIAIVACVVQDLLPSDYYRTLSDMRLVCAGWNKLIEATPALWSVIDFAGTRTTIEQHLARAQNAALSVHCRMGWKGVDRETFRELAVPTLSRCWAVDLDLPLDCFDYLATTPAPALRTAHLLFFTTTPSESVLLPIDLFASQAPLLENIWILELPVRWTSPIFAGLRCLKIKKMGLDSPVIDLVEILLRCPRLSTLEIKGCAIEDATVTAGQAVPIPLPELEVLHLASSTSHVLVYIIENLEACPTKQITIDLGPIMDEQVVRRLQLAGRTLLSRAQGPLRALQHLLVVVTIGIGENIEVASVYDKDQQFALHLKFKGPATVPWGPWFCQSALPSLPDSVKLTVHFRSRPRPSFPSDFAVLPQVETLRVMAVHDIKPFLEWMSAPIHAPNGGGGAQKDCWPFPGLREFEVFDGTVDAEDLLKLLEPRYNLRSPDGAASEVQTAPRLQTLRLPYTGKVFVDNSSYDSQEHSLFQKIKIILGQGVLRFESGEF
ncbi:hypothetical protein FRC04_005356 [Tulasnella sp. 424]|nr:hypothetical protein FRC04_005356 [Tulasnella sp. 424]KAG8976465.1 hypothetical protein FRC05_003708 [Tulasnella sp. 425]